MSDVPFPRTSRPALSALEAAGYTHLQQLDGVPMHQVLALHGMGPKGIRHLRDAMAQHGWAFADDDPRVGAVKGGVVSTQLKNTGKNDNQTGATGVDPVDYVESLPTRKQVEQGRAMLKVFGDATGEEPRMWGPSMIGYGDFHYVYESGREGDTFRVGFSPRKASLSLYGLQGFPGSEELLERLGKHRTGVSCVYVTNLDNIDSRVLRQLVEKGWAHNWM